MAPFSESCLRLHFLFFDLSNLLIKLTSLFVVGIKETQKNRVEIKKGWKTFINGASFVQNVSLSDTIIKTMGIREDLSEKLFL